MMKMMGDPPLHTNEIMLWRDNALWELADRPNARIAVMVWRLGLAILSTLAFAWLIHETGMTAGRTLEHAFWTALWIPALTLSVLLWVNAVKCGFGLFASPRHRPASRYVLTDRRLIISHGPAERMTSVMKDNFLYRAQLEPNGDVWDIHLWFSDRPFDDQVTYEEPVVISAISDGERVKTLLIGYFESSDDMVSARPA